MYTWARGGQTFASRWLRGMTRMVHTDLLVQDLSEPAVLALNGSLSSIWSFIRANRIAASQPPADLLLRRGRDMSCGAHSQVKVALPDCRLSRIDQLNRIREGAELKASHRPGPSPCIAYSRLFCFRTKYSGQLLGD